MDGIKDLVDSWKEQEKKEKNPIYQKAKNLKKTKLNQLKELIAKATEKVDVVINGGSAMSGTYFVAISSLTSFTIQNKNLFDVEITLIYS
jgi:fructose-1-phosphate kinase PfkB-like protein